MEESFGPPGEDPVEKSQIAEKQTPAGSSESTKRVAKTAKPSVAASSKVSAATGSARKRLDSKTGQESTSTVMKPTVSASLKTSNTVPVARRNSTGGLPEKRQSNAGLVAGKKTATPSGSEPVRRSLPEHRRSSLPPVVAKASTRTSVSDATRKSVPVSPVGRSLKTSTGSDITKQESWVRAGSLSSSLDRSSSLSGRRKAGTPESRDSRFIVLPQVEMKAGDDVRLDLRGHRVRSLKASGLNLSANLEFVYLRDNLLSTLEGVEILTRVKVLDLSFNDFKGPGFEPLENCKALQQLYLAGNQITSLASLPQLPNLEVEF
ncbi:hypothetical protein SLA2020_407220 [Shorea laevis]